MAGMSFLSLIATGVTLIDRLGARLNDSRSLERSMNDRPTVHQHRFRRQAGINLLIKTKATIHQVHVLGLLICRAPCPH
jgi:hypothetical protein